jgi:hypothetical protein
LFRSSSTLDRVSGRKKQRKSEKVQSTSAWLRSRVCYFDIGELVFDRKTGKSHPVHLNPNERIREHFNTKRRLTYLTKDMLTRHWFGESKFYFTACGSSKSRYTLTCLDADAHDFGSVEGCVNFLELMREKLHVDMYVEPSDRGGHGYLEIDKDGWNAIALKHLLLGDKKHEQPGLQDVLFHLLEKSKIKDVQHIEVKGTPAILTYDNFGRVTNVCAGVLCSLPQDREAFDKWRLNHTPVDANRLNETIERIGSKIEPPTVQEKRKLRVVGSSRGVIFDDAELKKCQFGGHYYKVARTLMNFHELPTSTRTVVTFEDLAILLMLLRYFTNHMNKDGSLPWARVKTMWDSLGDEVPRQFDCHRYAAMQRFLSSLDLLDWQDPVYKKPIFIGDQKIKGKAAKWRASEKLMELLEKGQEEKEAPLAETEITDFVKSLVQLPPDETIRPVSIEPEPIYWWNGDEIEHFVTSIDRQLAI